MSESSMKLFSGLRYGLEPGVRTVSCDPELLRPDSEFVSGSVLHGSPCGTIS